jgi:phosphoglycolate phosphatase-like HAD superfamily hydrolase
MKLVMFDIDGTLTETFAVDSDCYLQALAKVRGFEAVSPDWASYRHTTDSGILDEIYRTRLGRPPRGDEIEAVRHLFVRLLEQAARATPNAFAAVPGGGRFIELLRARGYAVALASGGWEESARLKLHCAGLKLEEIPAAFADDALSRCEIMLGAEKRAAAKYGVTRFDEVTYVGDASWDAKASQELDYRFVGRASDEDRARRLTELGAVDVLADYLNLEKAEEALRKKRLCVWQRQKGR